MPDTNNPQEEDQPRDGQKDPGSNHEANENLKLAVDHYEALSDGQSLFLGDSSPIIAAIKAHRFGWG